GVQDGEHHLRRGNADFVHAGGDAAAVVENGDRTVPVERHVGPAAGFGQMFVHRMVDDFPDDVVQSRNGRAADVHARPFPDGLEAFQHLDVVRIVTARTAPEQIELFRHSLAPSRLRRTVGSAGPCVGPFSPCKNPSTMRSVLHSVLHYIMPQLKMSCFENTMKLAARAASDQSPSTAMENGSVIPSTGGSMPDR